MIGEIIKSFLQLLHYALAQIAWLKPRTDVLTFKAQMISMLFTRILIFGVLFSQPNLVAQLVCYHCSYIVVGTL